MANGEAPITQDGLNRLEANAKEREKAFHDLMDERDKRYSGERDEIHRRLGDLNNSHNKAVDEKRRTDEAALKVQERMVEKTMLDAELKAVNAKIDDLRETRSKEMGKDQGLDIAKQNQKWIVGIGITLLLFILAQAVAVWGK